MKRNLGIPVIATMALLFAFAQSTLSNAEKNSADTKVIVQTSVLPPQPVESIENRVDTLLRTQMKMDQVPGLSIVVGRDGKVVLSLGYGYADVRRPIAATTETRYEVGSIT